MSVDRKGARLRAEAAIAVDAVVTGGRSLDLALAAARVAADDQPLLKMLCYGTLRHHWRLRSQLSVLLTRPLKKRDSVIESLAVVGLYQLGDTRIPDHAAVSMTAEAAKVLRRPKYTGLINAVLRNFRRKNIPDQPAESEEEQYNHPDWLLRRMKQDWPDHWQEIAAANNERAPMWLRVNTTQCSRDDYLARLASCDMPGETVAGLDEAIRLVSPADVTDLPGFDSGSVSVQDAAAQLAAPWILASGGRSILDACAAPGGKTGHLLELAGPDAVLTAIDADPERLTSIGQNLERLGLHATVKQADASKPYDWWDGNQFDRILLDAPCSATGVIRRHPDIRLLRRDADISALAEVQKNMLTALWPTLAPGGRLLYVTCSVLADENEAVADAFLSAQPGAAECKVLPNNNIRDLMVRRKIGYQVLPGTKGLDGFYFACLDKDAGTES